MKQIKLTKGKFTTVDDSDYESLNRFKWCAQKTRERRANGGSIYYASHCIVLNGKKATILMHRFLMKAPKGKVVDHLNHDGLDNRRENLRLCTNKENLNNRIPRDMRLYFQETIARKMKHKAEGQN